jgi:hypothetical protein
MLQTVHLMCYLFIYMPLMRFEAAIIKITVLQNVTAYNLYYYIIISVLNTRS